MFTEMPLVVKTAKTKRDSELSVSLFHQLAPN